MTVKGKCPADIYNAGALLLGPWGEVKARDECRMQAEKILLSFRTSFFFFFLGLERKAVDK